MSRIVVDDVANKARRQKGQTQVDAFKELMLNEKQGKNTPHNLKERRYKCEECGKKYLYHAFFRKHMEYMHDGYVDGEGKKIQCSVCHKRYQTEEKLEKHMTAGIHKTGSTCKLYCCALCGEKFLRDYQLGQHKCHLLDKKLLPMKTNSRKRKWQTSEVDSTWCPICDKLFTTNSGWQRHMTIHFGQQNYKCSLCSRQFTGRRELQIHSALHTGERPFKCSFCPKTCASKSNLDKHEQTHVSVYYVCCVCGMEFVKREDLQAHKCQNHDGGLDDEIGLVCKICIKDCSSMLAFKEHMSTHKDTHPHVCSWCGERFTMKQNLTEHHKKRRPLLKNVDYPYQCQVCMKRFSKRYYLERHKVLMNHEEDLQQKCPQIPTNQELKESAAGIESSVDIFAEKGLQNDNADNTEKTTGNSSGYFLRTDTCKVSGKNLMRNENEDDAYTSGDTKAKEYHCDECGKKMTVWVNYQKHMKEAHDKSVEANGVIQCSICGEKVKTDRSLQRHLTIHKEGGQFYHCGLCGEKFLRYHHLSHHSCHQLSSKFVPVPIENGSKRRKWQTSGVDDTLCLICNKTFTSSRSWQRHMTVHLGQENFTCPLCSRKFTGRRELRNHLRLHTGERPFKCSFCPKRCATKCNMTAHERSHLAVYYACCLCGEEFVERNGLRVHKCKAEQNSDLECKMEFLCNVCDEIFDVVSVLKQHMACHADTHPHTCSRCGTGFKVERDLRKHFKKERPLSECLEDYPFQCKVCLKRFNKQRKLLVHEAISHPKEDLQRKSLQKKNTNRDNTNKVAMVQLFEKHVDNISSGIYPGNDQGLEDSSVPSQSGMHVFGLQEYECLLCDKKLSTKDMLKKHLKIHTGIKPHKCSKCNKRFDSRSERKKHKRSHKKKKREVTREKKKKKSQERKT